MEELCAERQANIAKRAQNFFREHIERKRPANTRGAYRREKRKWEAYLEREGITSLPANVTSSTPAVLASYLTERLNIASSRKRTLSKSVFKHAKAVLTRIFEEAGWTGAWRGGAKERAPEGNPVRSQKVRDVIQLRRNAAVREGIVPMNADPTEYEFLGLAFRALKKGLYPVLSPSTRDFGGPLEIVGNRVEGRPLRDLRAYCFAVVCMGTLSRLSELARRR